MKKKFITIIITILLMVSATVIASPLKNRILKIEKDLIENRKFLEFSFDHILPGNDLLYLEPRIKESSKLLNSSKKSDSKKRYKTLIKVKRIQSQLIQDIAKIYSIRTEIIDDFISNKYLGIIETQGKAYKYLKLGRQESHRALTYRNCQNEKLAIHTYRLARSFFFRVLFQIKKEIPTQFVLELTDLSSLPRAYHPPQLKNISLNNTFLYVNPEKDKTN